MRSKGLPDMKNTDTPKEKLRASILKFTPRVKHNHEVCITDCITAKEWESQDSNSSNLTPNDQVNHLQ